MGHKKRIFYSEKTKTNILYIFVPFHFPFLYSFFSISFLFAMCVFFFYFIFFSSIFSSLFFLFFHSFEILEWRVMMRWYAVIVIPCESNMKTRRFGKTTKRVGSKAQNLRVSCCTVLALLCASVCGVCVCVLNVVCELTKSFNLLIFHNGQRISNASIAICLLPPTAFIGKIYDAKTNITHLNPFLCWTCSEW